MLSGDPIAQAMPESTLTEDRIWLTVGEQRFAITLDNSETSWALAQQLPFTLGMTDLNVNEKYAS
ncbi:hypothetical protein D3C77_581890 [compost metagenome]